MNWILSTIFLLVAVMAPVSPLAAAGPVDEFDRGPKVGQAIPHSLRAPDQNNQYRDFKSLARERGLIVLFSRSLGW